MDFIPNFLITIGSILLLGLVTEALGRRTFLPRVTLLLIFGIIIGGQGLGLIPKIFSSYFDIIADMTLLIVCFLIGGKLAEEYIQHSIGKVIWISAIAAVGTTVVVFAGLWLFGTPVEIAILLGCIAAATAPAATVDIIIESNYKGPFADLLIAIVALDDAWGLILFSIGMAIVSKISGVVCDTSSFMDITQEIGGALLLGALLGVPSAYLTGRIKPGQPMLSEALGIVFLCGGIAIWLDVSFLIAAITMGFVVAAFAKHHEYPFHAIEDIEWPFMVIFFVLAGASLEFTALKHVEWIGIMYILFRMAGKLSGAWLGCLWVNTDQATRQWLGVALFPQAGVAIGMALVASTQFPQFKQTLISITISATIFFEIIGPIFSRLALKYAQGPYE